LSSITIAPDGSAILRAPASARLLNALIRLEGRRSWLKSGGLSFQGSAHNIEVIRSAIGTVEIIDPSASGQTNDFDGFAKIKYVERTPSYPHQKVAAEKMGERKTFALFMEQGTGKTKVLIDWWSKLHLAGKLSGVLVISKNGVHRQWAEGEIPKHSAIEVDADWWRKKPPEFQEDGSLQVFCVNYDALRTIRGFDEAERFAKAHSGRLMIIADESQEIKNASAARSKAMMRLRRYAPYRALATGTPIAKDLTDEWAQLRWLNEDIIGIRYITTFRSEYCVMGGFQAREVVGTKNLEKFQELTAPWVYRVKKEDIGLLPKQFSEWSFDFSPTQVTLFNELKSTFSATLDGYKVDVTTAASALMKIQQVASGFIMDKDGKVNQFLPNSKNPRIQAMLDWIDSFDGTAIVWCRFRQDILNVKDALSEAAIPAVTYYGETKAGERKENLDTFLSGKARILVANAASAGTGLNLQGLCRNALYYSNSFSFLDREQSEDRIHRIGVLGGITYTDLIGKGGGKSIDRHLLTNLRKKRNLSALVLDVYREIILGG
jgi:hypothetical protein